MFRIGIFSTPAAVGELAARFIVRQVKTGRGTVLTPGCNSPLSMYRALPAVAYQEGVNLPALLKGVHGDFHFGMIDGTECPLEDPKSFPFYLAAYFLRFLGIHSPLSLRNLLQTDKVTAETYIQLAIDRTREVCGDINIPFLPKLTTEQDSLLANYIRSIYRRLQNVYVPWLPTLATEAEKTQLVDQFNTWLLSRLPIDLIICGIGPDGHIAFLGPATQLTENLAECVQLWEGIRDWKWGERGTYSGLDGRCVCALSEGTVACPVPSAPPQNALTISLRTFLTAHQIILLALGAEKAEPIHRFLHGPYSPALFPAHHLWDAEGDVIVLLDQAAASKPI